MATTAAAENDIVITLTSSDGIPAARMHTAQSEICKMIDKAVESKLAGFEKDLGNISDDVFNQKKEGLVEKMNNVLITQFDEKLEKFYAHVAETNNPDLIERIISELGIQFDDALAGNKDGWNYGSYAKTAKATESEDELTELRRRLRAVGLSPLEKAQIQRRLEELLAEEAKEEAELKKRADANGGRKTKQNKTRRKNQNKTRRKNQNKTKRKKQNKTKRKK